MFLLNKFQDRRYYFWILLLALVLRVLWSLLVPVVPLSDSNAYDVFAQNIVNCNNYGWNCTEPSAYWPVGTSFIYSIFYRIFGHTYAPIVIFHIVISLVTIGLTMYLAEQWFGRRVAALTGIFMAVWFSQVQMTTILASELIFNTLVIAALVIWLYQDLNLWLRSAIAGVLLAGACYVRPTALLIPILLLFARYVSTREIKRSLIATGIMFAFMGLLIAPWSLRNYNTFGQFVLISTNGGANFWMGNNPQSTGEYMEPPAETNGMNEAARDTYLKEQAKAYIKENPLQFVAKSFQRVVITHSRESISVEWNKDGLVSRYGDKVLVLLKLLNLAYWLLMLALGLTGAVLLVQKLGILPAIAHPTILFWGYYAMIHAATVAQDRYHFPSIPMIAILAGFTALWLMERFGDKAEKLTVKILGKDEKA